MKKLLVLLMALFTLAQVDAQEKNVIRIATDNTDLILQVAPNGRLYQAYLGDKLLNEKDINNFSPYVKGGSDGSVSTRGWEVYPGSGAEDYFEPAVAITHNDGNPSTILRYISSEETVKKRWKEDSAQRMTELADLLESLDDFSLAHQEEVVMKWIEDHGYHLGNIMNAFRLTLVGEGKGPHMFDISAVLGKEETVRRMRRAIEVLK